MSASMATKWMVCAPLRSERDSPKRWIQDQPERRRSARQADGLFPGSANRCPFGAWISDGGSPAKCSRRPIRYRRIRGTRHTRSCAALRAPRRVLQRCRTIRSASGPPAREPGWRTGRRHPSRCRMPICPRRARQGSVRGNQKLEASNRNKCLIGFPRFRFPFW